MNDLKLFTKQGLIMIKRSFFTLSQPGLIYDLVEPDPKEPVSIPIPPNLILLLNEPIANTRQALIKKGAAVEKGEKLCLYNDSTEYTISPVTGIITAIDSYADVFGKISTYLVINNDQSQTSQTDSAAYDLKDDITSADQYLRTLPGAPPLKALARDDVKINTIVITGADSDLLSTTSQYVMLKSWEMLKEGARVLKTITKIPKICITIPENSNIQGGLDSIVLFKTASKYPSNLPAMVLKDHLNMVLPAGKTPEDLGVCFICAEAVVSLAKAYKKKSAEFEKILTVTGKKGTRYRAKANIGTPLHKVFKAFGIRINDQDRIIIGGPMRGFSTFTHNHPVQPDMDTIVIQSSDIIPEISDYPCVNCGKCLRICPANVPVNILVRYLEADQYEEAADKYDLDSCIECGLCSYVCTAKIPLFQYIQLGKNELLKLRAEV